MPVDGPAAAPEADEAERRSLASFSESERDVEVACGDIADRIMQEGCALLGGKEMACGRRDSCQTSVNTLSLEFNMHLYPLRTYSDGSFVAGL